MAADTRYRPPRAGDILRSDEDSVRRRHRRCVERLRGLEKSGYRYEVLTISITHHWLFDNGPLFASLAGFVATWNRLGLEPRLRLTTMADAMQCLEGAMGDTAPECMGAWTGWWANGTGSAPREVTVSRVAKRFVADGAEGLADRREDNGEDKITEEDASVLLSSADQSPRDHGYDRPTWTRELFIKVLEDKTGITISTSSMCRLLPRLEIGLKMPKPIVGCPWKKRRRVRRLNEMCRFTDNAPAAGVVLYVDEVDVHLNPKIVPTICDVGHKSGCQLPEGIRDVTSPGHSTRGPAVSPESSMTIRPAICSSNSDGNWPR